MSKVLQRLNKTTYVVNLAPHPDLASYFTGLWAALINDPHPVIIDLTTQEVRAVRDQMTQDLRKH